MALDAIAELGARNVHITLENGCFALVREERQVRRYRAVTPRLEPVSVVGAGDALLAQWLTAILDGAGAEEALRARRRRGRRVGARGRRGPLRPGRGAPPRRGGRGARAQHAVLDAAGADRSARLRSPHLGDPQDKFAKEGLTFDDVLLVPAESAVLPNDVVTATRLTRTIALEIPIVSAAMDTVTEARMAIALARLGGIGVLHRNLSIDDQVAEVDKVKRSEAGMIVEPVTLSARRARRRRARADGALPRLRHPDHRRRRSPRRDPHEPRPPVRRRRPTMRVARRDDERGPRHGAGRARRSRRRRRSSAATGSRSCRSSTSRVASRA